MIVPIKRHGRIALLAAMSLSIASCMEDGIDGGIGGGQQPRPIARVDSVSGGGAVINSAAGAQMTARNGALLYNGDGFSTDAQSSMMLTVLVGPGGSINAEPGTDPLLTDAACFTISFFNRGTIEVLGHHFCVNGPGGVVFLQDSDVVYHIVAPGVVQVTVKEGRVTIANQPGFAAVTGQSFQVRGGRVTGVRTVGRPGEAVAPRIP